MMTRLTRWLGVVLVIALVGLAAVPAAAGPPRQDQGGVLTLVATDQIIAAEETFQIVLGDVDSDGDLDAVFSNMGSHHARVWFNDGLGTFTPSDQELTAQAHGIGIGDFDADGDLDLFITCAHYGSPGTWRKEPSRVYLNDGTGHYTDSGQDLGDLDSSGNSVDLVDIDTDGDLDAVLRYFEEDHAVYLNEDGVFTRSTISFPYERELRWGDLDADGDTDVFFKTPGVGYGVALNDGAGQFSDAWTMPDDSATHGYRSVGLADFEGDGDLDALVTNGWQADATPVIALRNDGTGQFAADVYDLPVVAWSWVEFGDLTGDGFPDAYLASFGEPDQVLINDGAGQFSDSGLALDRFLSTRGLDLGDLDGDGDLDVFVAQFARSGLNMIWFNQ
jgi:predicted lipoprotein with Yx(FWY)xxD motif